MKIDTYKSSDIAYGEDGYLERTIETYYDYLPKTYNYLNGKLFIDIDKYFNSMVSDIGDDGFIRSTFVLPSTLIKREKTKKFMYSETDDDMKEINNLKLTYYFPYEVKKVIMQKLEELAKENNYYIKLYYTFDDYSSCYLDDNNRFGSKPSIVSALYTEKRFLESFSNELKYFRELYDNCIKEYNDGYSGLSFELVMANLYNRLEGIIEYYSALPNIRTLIEEAGIELNSNNKSVTLKKTI